jgi:hypothetical protein
VGVRAITGAAALALLLTAPTGASAAKNSFDGTCRLSGELRFATPLGNELRTTTYTDVATGTCTGTLNGVARAAIPVVNHATGSATASCLAGHTTAADTLTFARRVRIRVFTDAVFGLTQVAGRFRGAVSGAGIVEANLLPYTDQSTLAACQAGTLSRARYDLTARTITPMVGEQGQDQGASPSPKRGWARTLTA